MIRRAIVIGGGPAGSSAATFLARTGWKVELCEAKRFPRAKVCGEFISPAARRYLEMLIGADELKAVGARKVEHLVIDCGLRKAQWTMPIGRGGAWVLSRRSLDSLLIEQAQREGVNVHQPAQVRTVRYFDERVEVDIEEAGDTRTLTGDVVIHADGAGRFDAPGVDGSARTTPMRKGVVGQKCHVRLPVGESIEGLRMHSCRGAYVGMVGIEDGLATIALVAQRELVARFGGDADGMLQSLWRTYDPKWREGRWMSCGVAKSGYIPGGHLRSFRVGNAAGAVEPVGGEGIGLALWSGWRLSQGFSTDEALSLTAERLQHVQHVFGRAYRSRLRLRRPACLLAARVLMRPAVVRTIWPVLTAPVVGAALLKRWYRLTGKPIERIGSSRVQRV